MIDGLDPDDLCLEPMVLLGQEPQKLQLCRRRSDHQDLVGVPQNGRNVSEELRTVIGMRVLGGWAFGVSMKMMFRGGDRLGLEPLCVDAEDARLLMVEPNDGLMSLHGGQ